MDIIDIRPGEDGYWQVAQVVTGLLAGLRRMDDGFRCALPILRADPYGYYRHPHP
jgi:hypothetical protein